MFPDPLLGRDEVTRTNRGAEGINSRVKFLPLAWAGMPQTSFRKNSDSPHNLVFGRVVAFSPEYHYIFYSMDGLIPAAVFLKFLQTHALDCNGSVALMGKF